MEFCIEELLLQQRRIRSLIDCTQLHKKEDSEKRRRRSIFLRRLLFNVRGDCDGDEEDILLREDSFDNDFISIGCC